LKILIATNTFPPNKDGVSEAASLMALAFCEKGWDVEIATEPIVPAREAPEWKGIPIHEFKVTGSLRFPYPLVGEVEAYMSFLMEGNWDVIIFHSYAWPLYVAVPILDKIKAMKVLVSHGYGALQWIPTKKPPFGFAQLARSIVQSLRMLSWMKKIDRVVYLTEQRDWKAFYDHRLASFINHSGIRVIHNGVDPGAKAPVSNEFRESLGIPKERLLFLSVANYSRRKDQGFAARAFRQAGIPNATLVFIGSEFNEWSSKFQQEDSRTRNGSDLGKIIWLEKYDRESTLAAFAECDAFLLSADHEAQPIALLEAMREKKPWIARDAGCISEIPGGMCVRTEKEMAQQMILLAKDPILRASLGEQGQLAIEETYNHQHYIHTYCKLVSEVVGAKSDPRSE
jgi:glycosyltransferase involved in cell wall biosynthesis